MLEIEPLGDRIIVRPDAKREIKKNGIIIPEMAQERPQEGMIESVGDRVKFLKPGERILYGKYAGSEVKIGDEEFLIMNEEDVIGKRRLNHETDADHKQLVGSVANA